MVDRQKTKVIAQTVTRNTIHQILTKGTEQNHNDLPIQSSQNRQSHQNLPKYRIILGANLELGKQE